MSFSSPLDRLVFIVAVSPATSTSMMLSYHDVLKSGTPKISARYCLMVCERESSVFDVDSASLTSGVNFITGAELALIAVLPDAKGGKKIVAMKTKTIEEINRSEMCSMVSLILKWIAVGRHKFVYISSYHRISTEEMSYLEVGGRGKRTDDRRQRADDSRLRQGYGAARRTEGSWQVAGGSRQTVDCGFLNRQWR